MKKVLVIALLALTSTHMSAQNKMTKLSATTQEQEDYTFELSNKVIRQKYPLKTGKV